METNSQNAERILFRIPDDITQSDYKNTDIWKQTFSISLDQCVARYFLTNCHGTKDEILHRIFVDLQPFRDNPRLKVQVRNSLSNWWTIFPMIGLMRKQPLTSHYFLTKEGRYWAKQLNERLDSWSRLRKRFGPFRDNTFQKVLRQNGIALKRPIDIQKSKVIVRIYFGVFNVRIQREMLFKRIKKSFSQMCRETFDSALNALLEHELFRFSDGTFTLRNLGEESLYSQESNSMNEPMIPTNEIPDSVKKNNDERVRMDNDVGGRGWEDRP